MFWIVPKASSVQFVHRTVVSVAYHPKFAIRILRHGIDRRRERNFLFHFLPVGRHLDEFTACPVCYKQGFNRCLPKTNGPVKPSFPLLAKTHKETEQPYQQVSISSFSFFLLFSLKGLNVLTNILLIFRTGCFPLLIIIVVEVEILCDQLFASR